MRIYWLYLGDDGTFVKDPKFGVDPINYNLEKINNSANLGTYIKTNNSINVKYLNGKSEKWNIEYLNGKINTIDGLYSSMQSSLPGNFKLNGSFSGSLFTENVASLQTYIFKNDGTVTIKGLGAIRNNVTNATAKSTTTGTYTISGNTLHIHLTSKPEMVAVIGFLPGDKPSIIINDQIFKG